LTPGRLANVNHRSGSAAAAQALERAELLDGCARGWEPRAARAEQLGLDARADELAVDRVDAHGSRARAGGHHADEARAVEEQPDAVVGGAPAGQRAPEDPLVVPARTEGLPVG
jgi:hypothetical protein